MSRFRFSRWLAGLSTLFAVVLIAAGGASAQTLWDFAALLGNTGPCQDLGGTETVAQAGFGSIDLVAELGGTLLTVKGGDLPAGSSEKGLGLAQGTPCNGDEVGDGGAGTLLMSFNNVLPAGSTVTSVLLGSLQTGECYRLSISTDGGSTFGAASQVCPATEVVTVPIGLPTAGLVLKFEKATSGTGDNDYTVGSVTITPPATAGCTLTQGFWKNHPGAWPVNALTIGGIVYTKAELIAIMQAPTKGNGLMSLVQQLIAAKLNVLSGAAPAPTAAITAADTLIDNAGGKIVIGPPSSPFLDPSVTSALNTALTNFNEGTTGPGHCTD
jgi:hypothetical protein